MFRLVSKFSKIHYSLFLHSPKCSTRNSKRLLSSTINNDQVYALLSELIRIPSVNPNLAPSNERDTSNETNIANFIVDWLSKNRIKAQIEEVQPGRLNVYAELGVNHGKTLCLCAHTDTVGVQEMTIPPFEPTLNDGKVYGRGSCDMKAGLASVMLAAKCLADESLQNGKLILALVCDEEYSSIGADDFVKCHKADACILTEPSDLNLIVAHKGFLWCKVTVHGKSAHGSRWDIGSSAISKMGPVLTSLGRFDQEILRKRVDDLVGPGSMHVSLIHGGTGVSTYADTCEIHVERRTLPSERLEDVKKELEEHIHQACPEAMIDFYFSRPPFKVDQNHEIVHSAKNAHHKILDRQATIQGWGVWTDAAIFQTAGIPTVNIGPIGYGLHEPVESVDLESVTSTTKILIEAAREYFEK